MAVEEGGLRPPKPASSIVLLKFGISSLVQQPAFAEKATAGEGGQRGTAFELFYRGYEGNSGLLVTDRVK